MKTVFATEREYSGFPGVGQKLSASVLSADEGARGGHLALQGGFALSILRSPTQNALDFCIRQHSLRGVLPRNWAIPERPPARLSYASGEAPGSVAAHARLQRLPVCRHYSI